jgi:hypothetical protein
LIDRLINRGLTAREVAYTWGDCCSLGGWPFFFPDLSPRRVSEMLLA